MASAATVRLGALYRLSLSRLIELDLVSSRGDFQGMVARAGGLLLALGLILMDLVALPCWRYRSAPMVWNSEEFLISITLAATGLASVLAWDSLLPNRRDSLVLGPLPVRTPEIAISRLMAVVACIASVVVSLQFFIGLSFPYVLADGFLSSVRAILAWWITVFAAGTFVFAWMLALQGTAAAIFSWHAFQRVSAALQMASLAIVLALFFMTPAFAHTMRSNPNASVWLPSYWFVGLLHSLEGDSTDTFAGLARIGFRNVLAVCATAGIVFSLAWWRMIRRIVEAPDIAPGSHRALTARLARWLANAAFPHPLDRAILLFTARTLARSRQHRLLLAVYSGIGFALIAALTRGWFSPGSNSSANHASLLISGILLVICAGGAIRAVIVLPHSLPANWSFRVTAVQHPSRYFEAVRKAMLVLAIGPVWLLCMIAGLSLWPGRFAIEAAVILALLAMIVTEYALREFRKVPFTCSWLSPPGVSTKMVKALAWGLGFLIFAGLIGQAELFAIESAARFAVLFAAFLAWAWWLRRRSQEFATACGISVQFDDTPPGDIFALDLRLDGAWSSEQAWVDAIDTRTPRSLAWRVNRAAVVFTCLATIGVLYQKINEWRDHREFPQIGRSIDIGGRSLNISCIGEGAPAVVMDSGNTAPGYSWSPVQRGVSAFARACWYDRAGYGWSDPMPAARTAADIAADLHRLLSRAGVAPPWVLVGHSAGGFNVRVFAARYPADTTGLVLVDSASEHAEDEITPPLAIQAPLVQAGAPQFVQSLIDLMAVPMTSAGVSRLLDNGIGKPPRGFSEREWQMMHALRLQTKSTAAIRAEEASRRETIRQVRAVTHLGNMPILVLTAGKPFHLPSDDPEESRLMLAYYEYKLYKDQPRMLTLSTRSRQVILKDTGHDIPIENPNAVVEAVKWVLASR